MPGIEIENDPRAELWKTLKQVVGETCMQDLDQIVLVATRLLVEWSRSRDDLREVLAFAVEHDQLNSKVLCIWEAAANVAEPSEFNQVETVMPPTQGEASESVEGFDRMSDGSGEDQAPPIKQAAGEKRKRVNARKALTPLPTELLECDAAIGEFNRNQGRNARALGQQLCKAQEQCKRSKYRFKNFLAHMKIRYGLHRSTCYSYMDIFRANMPDGLGVGVMTWIVGGFEKDSELWNRVIASAQKEGTTLDDLKEEYDSQREPSTRSARRTAPASWSALKTKEQRLVQQIQKFRTKLDQVKYMLRELESRGEMTSPVISPDCSRRSGRQQFHHAAQSAG